ncbi:MAG: DUF805 domain-containing protein [Clostridia bacterium]|nr:DUF805 domain-containing protein [Clostridia bacterium]
MKLINAYIDALKKWKHWDGRTSCRDYWFFEIVHAIVVIILVSLCAVCIMLDFTTLTVFAFIAAFAYAGLSLAPAVAAQIRRFHDSNRSGGCFFIQFIPTIGGVWHFVLLVLPGTKGPNQYGPDPYAPEVDENVDQDSLKDKTSPYTFE